MARTRILSPKRDSPYLGSDSSLGGDPDNNTFVHHTFLVDFVSILRIPEISYVGSFASRFDGHAPWSPLEFKVSPRIRWGLREKGLMASPALSRIFFGWKIWPWNIVRPSGRRRISLFAHWCWAEFLQLLHQCVHSLYWRIPKMRGVLVSASMSRATTRTKKFCIFTRIFSVIRVG